MIKVKNEFYSFVALAYVFLSLLGYQLATSLLLPLSSDVDIVSSRVTYPYRAVVFVLAFILIITSPLIRRHRTNKGMSTFYVAFMLIYFFRILIDIYFRRVNVLPSWRTTTLQYMFIVVIPSIWAMVRCADYIDFERLSRWLMWGGIAFLFLLIINQNTLIRFEYEEMSRGEINEAMGSLNLGYSCVMIFIILLSVFITKQYKWFWKAILVFFMLLSFVVMLRAASRGPLVCWLSVMLFFLFSRIKNKGLALLLSFSIVLIIWIFASSILDFLGNISPLMEQRMMVTIDEGNLSGRDVLFNEAIEMFMQHPLFGEQFVLHNGFYSHNSILDVMIGLGFFGALAWVFIIVKDIVLTSKNVTSVSSLMVVSLLSISYLIQGFFSSAMYISARTAICLLIVFVCSTQKSFSKDMGLQD